MECNNENCSFAWSHIDRSKIIIKRLQDNSFEYCCPHCGSVIKHITQAQREKFRTILGKYNRHIVTDTIEEWTEHYKTV